MAKKPEAKTRATRTAQDAVPKREVKAHENKKRPPRRPLSTTYKLTVPEGVIEKGYTYRWLLDRPERVHNYEAAWWEKVLDGEGKVIRKPSGGGEWLTLYRIESKYYEEDRAANRKKTINLLADKGKLQKTSNATEYVPEGHEAVIKFS